MNSIDQIPILILHILERNIAQDTGIVNQHVDATKALDRCVDDSISVLDAVIVGDSLSARFSDLLNDGIGILYETALAGYQTPGDSSSRTRTHLGLAAVLGQTQIVHDNIGAAGCKEQRIRLSQAAAGAGDDDGLIIEAQFGHDESDLPNSKLGGSRKVAGGGMAGVLNGHRPRRNLGSIGGSDWLLGQASVVKGRHMPTSYPSHSKYSSYTYYACMCLFITRTMQLTEYIL